MSYRYVGGLGDRIRIDASSPKVFVLASTVLEKYGMFIPGSTVMNTIEYLVSIASTFQLNS